MSTIMDPAKLKVVELRAELASRSLDTKGNKPVLVKRLREALEAESGNDLPDTSIADTSTEEVNTSSVSLSQPSPPPESETESKEPEREATPEPESTPPVESPPKSRSRTRRSDESSEKPKQSKPEPVVQPVKDDKMDTSKSDEKPAEEPTPAAKSPEKAPVVAMEEDKVPEQDKEEAKSPASGAEKEDSSDMDTAPSAAVAAAADEDTKKDAEQTQEQEDVEMAEDESKAVGDSHQDAAEAEKESSEPRNRKSRWGSVTEAEPTDSGGVPDDISASGDATTPSTEQPRGEKRRNGSPSPERVARKRSRSPIREDEPEMDVNEIQLSWIDSDLNLQVNKEGFTVAEPMHSDGFGYMWAGVRSTHGISNGKAWYEVKLLENCDWKEAPRDDKKKDKNKDKDKDSDKTVTDKTVTDKTVTDKTVTDKTVTDKEVTDKTDKPEEESTEKEKEKEKEKEEAPVCEKPVEPIHVFRVGWSLPTTDLQLGEQPHSYAYDSEGLSATDSQFTEFGTKYAAGDVIGAFLDMDTDSITISYTVNGELQPTAFTVERSQLPEDSALFPHILTRNIKFEVNFGQKEEPWFQPPKEFADFTFVKDVETKVAGLSRPAERKECEVVMMVGLPCSGKTHWVNNHVTSNPEKKYNVLGLGVVLDKMKYRGKSRKENFKGSVTVLMDKTMRCLGKLIDIASARRRNFIIDQTNLFSSAQRRKMRPFDGFRRQAVVIVVADDEQSSREKSRQQADGKDVPDSAVLEMKANMCLPTVCDWLDEVTYAELDEEKSKEMVQKYNKQGREAGYGPNYTAKQRSNNQKQQSGNDRRGQWGRNNKRDNGRDNRNNRWGGGAGGGGGGGGGHNRQNNWGGGNRGGSGGWGGRHDNRNHHHGGGGGGGGRGSDYRNNSNNRMMSGGGGGGGGYNNRNQGAGGGGGGGGGGYNRNRNQPPHRNQMQNKGGNWGGPGGAGGNWNSQGSWGNQGGWGGHQSGGQGGGSGSGWSQGSWGQYGNNQGGQGGGNPQWKGGYNAQQYQQQGYAPGYAAGQYGQGQYANWNYYGQYAQGWNAQQQGQQSGTGSSSDSTSNTAQYNQYTQQQQAAWAQYAQGGYGGYGQAASQGGGGGGNAITGSAATQPASATKQ